MSKIWLKNPDPSKQCCGCEIRNGPCDTCCTNSWGNPTTGIAPHYISGNNCISFGILPIYGNIHEPVCFKCDKLDTYATFITRPTTLSGFYNPISRPSYSDEWNGNLDGVTRYTDGEIRVWDFYNPILSYNNGPTNYSNNLNTVSDENVNVIDGLSNIIISPGKFTSTLTATNQQISDESNVLLYSVAVDATPVGGSIVTYHFRTINDLNDWYTYVVPTYIALGYIIGPTIKIYSNYTSTINYSSLNKLTIYNYFISSDNINGLNITSNIQNYQLFGGGFNFNCPTSSGDTLTISCSSSTSIMITEFSTHKTSDPNWIVVNNGIIDYETYIENYSARILPISPYNPIIITININSCFNFLVSPFETTKIELKNSKNIKINPLQRFVRNTPQILVNC